MSLVGHGAELIAQAEYARQYLGARFAAQDRDLDRSHGLDQLAPRLRRNSDRLTWPRAAPDLAAPDPECARLAPPRAAARPRRTRATDDEA